MTRSTDLRQLPAVHRFLTIDEVRELKRECGARVVTDGVKVVLAATRQDYLKRGLAIPDTAVLIARLSEWVHGNAKPRLVPVINATGIVLHTNLGRAPLSRAALEAICESGGNYNNLEFDLATGRRASRNDHCRAMLAYITGAEDAVIVNNNAAALLLMLVTLCQGREVVISRGQMVEVGGGFRIPDILAQSGARLREVGTTNRTYVSDYMSAVNEATAAILIVHASNFHQIGYTTQPDLSDVINEVRSLPGEGPRPLVLHDLGSGLLRPLDGVLEQEQAVANSIVTGADLVAFSCDKLLGGPQAGAIVGSAACVSQLKRHPLMRALRVGKLTLAALGATLEAYVHDETVAGVPALKMVARSVSELKKRASGLCQELSSRGLSASVVDLEGATGGGSMPGKPLPSAGVAIGVDNPEQWALALRSGKPPVIPVIQQNQVVLNLRAVEPEQDEVLLKAILAIPNS